MMTQPTTDLLGHTAPSCCWRCGRKLTNPASVKAGIGPVCARKVPGGKVTSIEDGGDSIYIGTPITDGIIIRRTRASGVVTNVPRVVVRHSPTGFEFGYGGSGPADLALNILEAVIGTMEPERHGGRTPMSGRTTCYKLAAALYMDFKWQWIAPIDGDVGAILGYDDVVQWIRRESQTPRVAQHLSWMGEAVI